MIVGLGVSLHPLVDLAVGWFAGWGARLSCRVGADDGEGVVEVGGPGSGLGDFEVPASLAVHDACGDVQQPVGVWNRRPPDATAGHPMPATTTKQNQKPEVKITKANPGREPATPVNDQDPGDRWRRLPTERPFGGRRIALASCRRSPTGRPTPSRAP